MAMNPFQFLQEVRQEVAKVTWPTWKEVWVTTIMVLVMVALAAAFFTIADLVRPRQSAKYLIMQSYDGYSTSMPLEAMLDDDVMIATHWNNLPLDLEHGGPARILVPKRYAWKSAKWIRELRFSTEDELGFWEKRGYSNTADPRTNDRFAAHPKLP